MPDCKKYSIRFECFSLVSGRRCPSRWPRRTGTGPRSRHLLLRVQASIPPVQTFTGAHYAVSSVAFPLHWENSAILWSFKTSAIVCRVHTLWKVAAFPHRGLRFVLTSTCMFRSPPSQRSNGGGEECSTHRGSSSRSPFMRVGPSPNGTSPQSPQTRPPESRSRSRVAQVVTWRRRTASLACRSVPLSFKVGLCGGRRPLGVKGAVSFEVESGHP